MTVDALQDTVWDHYARHKRDLPWRAGVDQADFPYKVLVSEFMLQQTQVSRVIPKFDEFLLHFPTLTVLAQVPLSSVLVAWQGLGYNRRAKYLHEAAAQFIDGIPEERTLLEQTAGIGPNTAAAIAVYAYNKPEVFIETNVRTIFLHHFFHDELAVPDRLLLPLVESALDRERPREWYWALMDYGTYLKQHHGNAAQRSAHYVRQSAFVGSRRQVRGSILRVLTDHRSLDAHSIRQMVTDDRVSAVLSDLEAEGLIEFSGERYRLPEHQTDRDTIYR